MREKHADSHIPRGVILYRIYDIPKNWNVKPFPPTSNERKHFARKQNKVSMSSINFKILQNLPETAVVFKTLRVWAYIKNFPSSRKITNDDGEAFLIDRVAYNFLPRARNHDGKEISYLQCVRNNNNNNQKKRSGLSFAFHLFILKDLKSNCRWKHRFFFFFLCN